MGGALWSSCFIECDKVVSITTERVYDEPVLQPVIMITLQRYLRMQFVFADSTVQPLAIGNAVILSLAAAYGMS